MEKWKSSAAEEVTKFDLKRSRSMPGSSPIRPRDRVRFHQTAYQSEQHEHAANLLFGLANLGTSTPGSGEPDDRRAGAADAQIRRRNRGGSFAWSIGETLSIMNSPPRVTTYDQPLRRHG